jgi:hypothetical protein
MRALTEGEIRLAREAFGDRIRYDKVRVSNGAGANPIAMIAFGQGNPAITLRSTIYCDSDYRDDLSATGVPHDEAVLLHELTHVWQYARMGMARFFLRYGREFRAVGYKSRPMYAYDRGVTRFEEAMLEAQAQMVGDYREFFAERPRIARNLAATGFYGL